MHIQTNSDKNKWNCNKADIEYLVGACMLVFRLVQHSQLNCEVVNSFAMGQLHFD